MTDIFRKYFPDLTADQCEKLIALKPFYERWNSMINVISRKDMDNFYMHHVLHSLALAKIIRFAPGTTILDVGTGGGFPGIPLAIMFPLAEFTLLDSIEKKIKVVTEALKELSVSNATPLRKRAEEEKGRYHFVISRAVTAFPLFVKITRKNLNKDSFNELPNGILYLKGGDLEKELSGFYGKIKIWNISSFFEEDFFETKKIVYLPA